MGGAEGVKGVNYLGMWLKSELGRGSSQFKGFEVGLLWRELKG